MTRKPSYTSEFINLSRGWLGRAFSTTWSRPLSVNVLVNVRCNSKCLSCDLWKMDDPQGMLGSDQYAKIADDLLAMNVNLVALSGGEPLLRRDLVDIIKVFADRKFIVQMTTNALLLKGDRAKEIATSGLSRLTISLDALEQQSYKHIRGVDGLAPILKNIENFKSLTNGHAGPKLEMNLVVSRLNQDDFLQTVDRGIEIGFDTIHINPVVVHSDNNLLSEAKDELSLQVNDQLLTDLRALRTPKYRPYIAASGAYFNLIERALKAGASFHDPCRAGFLSVDIYADGAVSLCGGLEPFANVKQSSLQKIWYSPAAEKMRRQMLKRDCSGCLVSCKMEPSLLFDPKTASNVIFSRVIGQFGS